MGLKSLQKKIEFIEVWIPIEVEKFLPLSHEMLFFVRGPS